MTSNYVSESVFQNRLESLKGTQRYWKLEAETHKVTVEQNKATAESIRAKESEMFPAIAQEGLNQTAFKLEAAKVKTGIEQVSLKTAQLDLRGSEEEYVLKQQAWDLKLQGQRTAIDLMLGKLQEAKEKLGQPVQTVDVPNFQEVR